MKLVAKKPVGHYFATPNTLSTLKVGTDPEMFVYSGDKLLPAFEFLPHKNEPKVCGEERHGFGVFAYWDGFQSEFRISVGLKCLMYLTHCIRAGLTGIHMAATEKDASAKLSLKSVVRIPKKTLADAFDPFVALGCEPSMNAYRISGIEVENPRSLQYRFAGGHMHFGISELTNATRIRAVKTLDKILGIWSIGAAQSFDNPIRRQYYGIPGEYRSPAHGLEYRVLSNFWLSHPVIMHAVFEIGRRAVYLSQTPYDDLWVAPEEMVVDIIKNSDVKEARKLMELNKPIFKWLMHNRGWGVKATDALFDVGLNGVESVVKDPEAITDNWLITKEPELFSVYREVDPLYTWGGYGRLMYPEKI